MLEVWKDVVNYEGLYQVSNLGRVKSCGKYVKHSKGGERLLKEKIRSLASDKNGYVVVDLYKNGKGKIYKVHRLVASSFINNEENKPQVNHINGVKNDNSEINLEWSTNSENQKHAFKIGLKLPSINNEKVVLMFDKNGNFIYEFKSIAKASKHLNCTSSDIRNTIMGRQKSVREHTFQYKN